MLQVVDDPEVHDQAAAGDREVLNPKERDGLRKGEVDECQGPDDQLEVALQERVAVKDRVIRIEVSMADQRPRLVVRCEVLGQKAAVVDGGGIGTQADHPHSHYDRAGNSQAEPSAVRRLRVDRRSGDGVDAGPT